MPKFFTIGQGEKFKTKNIEGCQIDPPPPLKASRVKKKSLSAISTPGQPWEAEC